MTLQGPDVGPPSGRWPAGRQQLWLALFGGILAPLGMALGGVLLAWVLRRENLVAAVFSGLPAPHVPGVPDWAGRVLPRPPAGVPALLVWGLGGAAVSLGVSLGLAAVWPRFAEALERAGMQPGDKVLRLAGWPVMFLVVGCGAVGEEVLFRGGIQPTLGVWATALLFGLAHGGWDLREMWSYVIAAGLAGLAFGYVYEWTGVLWAAMVAHVTHNVAVVSYLIYRQGRNRRLADGPPAAFPGPLPPERPGMRSAEVPHSSAEVPREKTPREEIPCEEAPGEGETRP